MCLPAVSAVISLLTFLVMSSCRNLPDSDHISQLSDERKHMINCIFFGNWLPIQGPNLAAPVFAVISTLHRPSPDTSRCVYVNQCGQYDHLRSAVEIRSASTRPQSNSMFAFGICAPGSSATRSQYHRETCATHRGRSSVIASLRTPRGPIDLLRPFELELFCVPAEEECSDVLLPFGCGLYGSVDPNTIAAFRRVCDTPARRLVTGTTRGRENSVTIQDCELAKAFGFIRAREDENFPIGTLAVANELKLGGFQGIVNEAPQVSNSRQCRKRRRSDSRNQLQPALFSYYGLARFHLLDITSCPESSPYPIGLVQLFYDHEPEAPPEVLADLENELAGHVRKFLQLNSSLAVASQDPATALLYDDRLDEFEALLSECRYEPQKVSAQWGKRQELISFFVCDHLDLDADERARLCMLRNSEERLRYALQHIPPLIAELAAVYSIAKVLPSSWP